MLFLELSPVENSFHTGNSDLDHVVGRLLGSDLLQCKTRLGQEIYKAVLRTACQADKLIRDTGNHRDQREAHEKLQYRGLHPDEHEDEDGDDHNDEDKAGSTSLMQSGSLLYIFDGEILTILDAVDALMLCAVIHEDTANLLHAGDQENVTQEEADADQTFDHIKYQIGTDPDLKELGQTERQHEEDHQGQNQ